MKGKKGAKNSIPVRSTTGSVALQRFPHFTRVSRTEFAVFHGQIWKKDYIMKKYTLPKLYAPNYQAQWHVEYYFEHPVYLKKVRIREYLDINAVKKESEEEGRLYGEQLVKFLTQKLEAGWSPFDFNKKLAFSPTAKVALENTVNDLSRKATKSKIASLNEQKRRLESFFFVNGYDELIVADLPAKCGTQYRQFLVKKKLSAKTINQAISYAKRFFTHFRSMGWVTDNPFEFVAPVEVERGVESEKFSPITHDEMRKIFNYCEGNAPPYYDVFLKLIYYCFIRPTEICKLQIEDINIAKELICIKGEKSKNGQLSYVQIPKVFLDRLASYVAYAKHPKDYLFAGIKFMPGGTRMSHQLAGKIWRRLVKQQLNINKDMYALKHTGNINYLLNNKGNVDLKWVQMQNRHSSIAMTERYTRKLGVYMIDTTKVNFDKF